MVGRKAADLNLGLPASLLARLDDPRHQAEASLHAAAPSHLGVRLLFAEDEEWRACVSDLKLPPQMVESDATLRHQFYLAPNQWLRVHFDGSCQGAASQSFVVMPHIQYPVTTLRVAVRRSGLPNRFDVEPLLDVVLDERDSQWGFTLRYEDGALEGARIFGCFRRCMLPAVMERLRRGGYLSAAAVAAYLRWDARLLAGDRIYLSLDPSHAAQCSVDFESVPTHSLPPGLWREARAALPAHGVTSYLKCRVDESGDRVAWTAYIPWWKFKLWHEMSRHQAAAVEQSV